MGLGGELQGGEAVSPRELRAIEARCAELHEERLATLVLAEARAESERIRQRAGQQRSTGRTSQTQRTESRCECGKRTRSASGVCRQCDGTQQARLVAYVATCSYGATTPQVAEALEIGRVAASKALTRAVTEGVLRRVSWGLYALGEVKP
jgi:hypothetical protein